MFTVRVVRALVVALVVASLTVIGCDSGAKIDFNNDPQTLATTIELEPGDSYTIGMTGPDEDALKPVVVRSVEVVRAAGVEILGVGILDPVPNNGGIGVVAGWPPEGFQLAATDDAIYAQGWDRPIYTVVGVRLKEPLAGLRGIEVYWLDGSGREHARVFDIAVLSCPAASCGDDEDEVSKLKMLDLQD